MNVIAHIVVWVILIVFLRDVVLRAVVREVEIRSAKRDLMHSKPMLLWVVMKKVERRMQPLSAAINKVEEVLALPFKIQLLATFLWLLLWHGLR